MPDAVSARRAIVESLEARRLLAAVPPGFADAVYATGLSQPTSMTVAPDGRLFVTQQGGQIRVVKNGQTLSANFASVATENIGERGLLGVALDPSFNTTRHVYVYYTVPSTPRHNRVSRFTAVQNPDGMPGDTAVPGSEQIILTLDNLGAATNHNGGALHFGPDGKLYVAVGDAATSANAQSLSTRHGKMLRINKDGSIPSDNPFFNTASGANRAIWAMGLRNPFTFSFKPGSSRMFINDVGQQAFEEINDGLKGRNYGWPQTEGFFNPSQFPDFTNPIHVYPHGSGLEQGRAITGGVFYDGPNRQFPSEFAGDYFHADWANGWIRTLDPAAGNATRLFATGLSQPVDLDLAPDGSLLYLERGNGGRVGRIRHTGRIELEAEASTGQAGGSGAAAGHTWSQFSDPAAFNGQALRATPNTGVNTRSGTNGPRRDYAINFVNPGTYYVWVRMKGATSADRSIHAGLNGVRRTPDGGMVVAPGQWQWTSFGNDGSRITVFVPNVGVHTLNLWMREDGVEIDRILLTKNGSFRPYFQATNDRVDMQAEAFTGLLAGSGAAAGHTWSLFSDSGAQGDEAIRATPNSGLNVRDNLIGPRRDYAINFTSTGQYYVWARMRGATTSDNAIHVGLNGAASTLGGGMPVAAGTGWRWVNLGRTGARVTVNVTSAGMHSFNLWMRDDGAEVDGFILTKNAGFQP